MHLLYSIPCYKDKQLFLSRRKNDKCSDDNVFDILSAEDGGLNLLGETKGYFTDIFGELYQKDERIK
jgi:hypothetical protein